MWGIRVHAYSLMPNHYHLVLETPRGNLSRAMRHLDGIYTQRYNRAHRSDGTLFRGRYKAILIDKNSYLLQVVRYIHLNPVQARIVKEPAAHPWTSHRYYAGKGGGPAGLVVEEVLGQFHKRRRQAIYQYIKFVNEGIDKQTRELYGRDRWPSIWGSEGFKEKIREGLEGRIGDYEIPQAKQEKGSPNLGLIENTVSERYGIGVKEFRRKQRGRWIEARNVAIYLGRTMGGRKLKELGEHWGGLKYSSVSGIIYDLEKSMLKDKQLRKRLEEIKKQILIQHS